MYNPFNPRPEQHVEGDPTIDRAMKLAAQAFARGATDESVLKTIESSGLNSRESWHVFVAAKILSKAV